jgi:hypothetical protein
MLHTDYAWDVITEYATELLDTHNLEKDQVRNIYNTISYSYYSIKKQSYYAKFVNTSIIYINFRLQNPNYIITECRGT